MIKIITFKYKFIWVIEVWNFYIKLNELTDLSSMLSFSDRSSDNFLSDSDLKFSILFSVDFFSRSRISIFDSNFFFSTSDWLNRSSRLSFCRWSLLTWN
jgi:hypothetical protein